MTGRPTARWREPLRGRPRRSWALDIALAVLLALFSPVQPDPQFAVALTGCVLLVFRRIWPVPVALGVLALGLVPAGHNAVLLLGGSTIVVHTLAVLTTPRRAALALAASEVWIGLLAVTVDDRLVDKIVLLALFSTPQVLAFVLGLYRRTRDAYQLELQARNRSLEVEREQRDLLAAADERARIAREMHDLIAHHLTVVVALSEGLARSGEITSDRSREAVTITVAMARQALRETRRLLGATTTEQSAGPITDDEETARRPVPGLRSLEGLVGQVRATGLPVTLRVEGTRPELPGGLQLTVYRLVQEALTNAMKHAHGATRAAVRLRYPPGRLVLSIEDDGEPGGAATPADGLGRGLAGMRERVRPFGGTLSAGPGPDGGWQVLADFPLTTNVEANR
ncbi:hypothetical protein KIH74_28045 [Kineosporia sp. J2-2]|uniref:histidine kinase n=1 Tax=Kineosporia corallincola TaxID=2835133 RepID=A0ABS5TQV0_9ACTN|nr:histidine kinase [Kineosporia corallincola]MBT0772826.1 hypothetical protein [Kineosporia corallincola]